MKKAMTNLTSRIVATAFALVFTAAGLAGGAQEVTEFKGEKLTPLKEQGNTYIGTPPEVDPAKYRLKITGKVKKPVDLSYEDVLAMPQESKVITLQCVEGWSFKALWTGVRIADLAAMAEADSKVKTVIFHEIGGAYSSALPFDYIKEKNILLAFRINGLELPRDRGFPFQVCAEDKFGYKSVKWVGRIEFSDKDYQGYWEKRGYSNSADIKKKQDF